MEEWESDIPEIKTKQKEEGQADTKSGRRGKGVELKTKKNCPKIMSFFFIVTQLHKFDKII